MKTYDFTYTDCEGDEYSSDQFNSLSEAKAEVKRLKQQDEDVSVTETWIYRDDTFIGRW